MDLFIRTAGVTDLSAAIVTSASDMTALGAPDQLPQLVLGTTEPITAKFLTGASAYETWTADPAYVVMASIGCITSDGTENLAEAELSTVIANGKSGSLALTTVALIDAIDDAFVLNRSARTVELTMQITVTDPTGAKRAYAIFPITIWGRVPAFNPTNATLPSTAYSWANITGKPGVATTAEVTTGTDNDKMVTPDALHGSSPVLNGVTSEADADLTLEGGNGGSSIVLEYGSGGSITITPKGIGDGNEFVDVLPTNANAAQVDNDYGLRVFYTISNTNASHAYRNAAILGEIFTPANNAQNYAGIQAAVYALAHHEGSGTAANMLAQYIVAGLWGTGNISEAFGQYISLWQAAGSTGHITSAYGAYVAPAVVAGSGDKPDNLYGFYFADNDGKADNVYSFFSAGNAIAHFGPAECGTLAASGVVSLTNTTAAATFGAGSMQLAGGASIAKNLWLGTQLRFEAGTDNTIGINFGGDAYLYRNGAGTVRLTGANFYVQGDIIPHTNATYDLGSSSLKWRQLFVSGAVTLSGGEVSYGANDSGGTGYRVVLVPNS